MLKRCSTLIKRQYRISNLSRVSEEKNLIIIGAHLQFVKACLILIKIHGAFDVIKKRGK